MDSYYEKNRMAILEKEAMKRLPSDPTHGSVYRLYISGNCFNEYDRSQVKSYVGSTKMDPKLRYKLHCSAFKRYTCGNGAYCSAFIIFADGEPTFEVLETVPLEDLDLRERYWSEQFNVVNKNKIGVRVKNNLHAYVREWLDKKNPEQVAMREFKRMARISCN